MHDELDVAFNEMWANNGDAISREYAGTSALKGDFTRTGKRNWRGAINDASNSVARLLQSTVSDFFRQAALDYILGVNTLSFQEFSERLETRDPGEILRLAAVRQEAIETSTREVLAEGERKVAAWTLLSPSEGDQVRPGKGGKFEEKVLVLSDKAVYVVSYEFSLQKVVSYTRIPTGDLLHLQHGAYILSSLEPSTRDPVENYGFVLSYNDAGSTDRAHTYSMRTESPKKTRTSAGGGGTGKTEGGSPLKPLRLPFGLSTPRPSPGAGVGKDDDPFTSSSAPSSSAEPKNLPTPPPPGETHFFAFKALRRDAVKVPPSSSGGGGGGSQLLDARGDADDLEGKTARELVVSIVARIRDEAEKIGAVGEEGKGEGQKFVEEKDVISLAESKAQTSLVDKLERMIYRAVWL